MRQFWIVLACIVLAITLPITWGFYDNYKVYTEGQLIKVTIVSLPFKNNVASRNGKMIFEYNGKNYTKDISLNNNYYVGEEVTLRYKEGFEYIFLYENENPLIMGVVALTMLWGTIIISFYYAYVRKPLK